jgi:diguanylate cyclase (GGDEF)-like protein
VPVQHGLWWGTVEAVADSPIGTMSSTIPHHAATLPAPDTLLDALPHGVAVVDEVGVVVAANRLWHQAEADGDPLVRPVGAPLLGVLRAVDRAPSAVAEHTADGLSRLLDGRGHSFQVQYELAPVDDLGEPRWFLVAAERLPDGGLVVTRTDTTVHHGVNEVLAELAFHDDLTGLPNRGLLLDRMRMALIRAQRLALRPLVVFGDLDGFKAVNDDFGHDAGDEVLIEAARRLTHAVREGDTCGRWGGDEFVLVIELGDAEAATKVIERVMDAMAAPFVLRDGSVHHIGLSIGAVVADGTERVEALIAAADRAMYQAKRERRGPVVVAPA